jgi:hypothetical protein
MLFSSVQIGFDGSTAEVRLLPRSRRRTTNGWCTQLPDRGVFSSTVTVDLTNLNDLAEMRK